MFNRNNLHQIILYPHRSLNKIGLLKHPCRFVGSLTIKTEIHVLG